jgi:dihydrolipoamide dehydrogenase
VKTDGHMRASLPGVYACGDAVGGALLAHLAFAEGRIAAENACGLDTAIDRAAVPACVYTSPEAAWVGLGEEAARESGRAVRTGRFDMRANGRSLCLGERDGFAKVVTDEKTGAILGGCILGESASEMLTALTLAVRFGLTASDLADTIFPHPTVSEALGEACADAAGRAIHK